MDEQKQKDKLPKITDQMMSFGLKPIFCTRSLGLSTLFERDGEADKRNEGQQRKPFFENLKVRKDKCTFLKLINHF